MIRRVMWFLFGVGIVAVPMLASATGIEWAVENTTNAAYRGGTKDSACSARAVAYDAVNSGTWTGEVVSATAPDTTKALNTWHQLPAGNLCWMVNSSGTKIQGYSIFYRFSACAAGETRDSSGNCVPPPCTAGQSVQVSAVAGYFATYPGTGSDPIIDFAVPSSGCGGSNNCVATIANAGALVPGTCVIRQSSTGLHPGLCMFNATTTATQCTGAQQEAATNPPSKPCPSGSSFGSVTYAGVTKTGCFGTYQGSEVTSTTNNPDGSTTKVTTSVAPDGSTTKTTETTQPDGTKTVVKEVITASPTSTGTTGGTLGDPGGTGGGTGGGTSGGAGGGTGEKGETEQADFCRDNPDSLICQDKLKIDETGTPEGGDPLKGERDAISGAWDSAKSTLEGDTWRKSSLPFVWSPSIPSGSCSPWEIYGRTIDLCDEMAKVRQLWAWVIYMVGALSLWMLGVRAMNGGK